MKAAELKTKTQDELDAMLVDLRKEQLNLRFQKAGGQLENTARMRVVRRDIARVKTAQAGLTAGTDGAAAKKAAPKKAAKPAAKTAKKTKE